MKKQPKKETHLEVGSRVVQVITLPPHLLRQLTEGVAREIITRVGDLRPKSKPNKKKENYLNPLVMDTSALIDGRILEVANCGFLTGTLIVPQEVLEELHRIADSSETVRRGRGRRGLDILASLRKLKDLKVKIIQDELKGKTVDEKLLNLTKSLSAKIITCDFNLGKLSEAWGVKVLNINDLANRLKTIVLPGEELIIKIIQEGKEKKQGVGYLPDGTMIVVEEGREFLGQEINVEVQRVLQTVAGRMIFVKQKQGS